MKPLSSKKSIHLALEELVKIVLFCLVIFASLLLMRGLYNMFAGAPNQGTVESFNQITERIQAELITNNKGQIEQPFYIQDNKGIYGFNKGESQTYHFVGYATADSKNGKINRPKTGECSGTSKACLCLCENGYFSTENACDKFNKCTAFTSVDYLIVKGRFSNCFYGAYFNKPLDERFFVIFGDRITGNGCGVTSFNIEKKGRTLYFSSPKPKTS